MEVLVLGATGTVGAHIARELSARGHAVRAASRSSRDWPVDLTTGAGLNAALDGTEVVVDASNAPPRAAEPVLVGGSERLVAAGAEAGVAHHVCVSIVGIDETPMAYYRLKVRQEAAVEAGSVPWTIVRATQFHELVAGALGAAAKRAVSPRGRIRVQPVAAKEVAAAIADVAAGPARRDRVKVAGPEVRTVSELARAFPRGTVPVPLPIPGPLGRALRAGTLTTDTADVVGTTTWEQWLASA